MYYFFESILCMNNILRVIAVKCNGESEYTETENTDPSQQDDHEFSATNQTNKFAKGSELVKKFLEHFKNPDSANLPLPIPDPLIMPDRIYPILTVKVTTTNVTAFGVSRIRVENFTSDVVQMKIHFGLRMPMLILTGNYSYHDWLMKHYFGGFNVTLVNALTDCNAKLEVTRDGELDAAEMAMDLVSREKMYISFENAGIVGFFVNAFGDSLFYAIKPYFLSLISSNIRSNINDQLKQIKVMFPNSIPPLDLAIAEGRKFVKSSGFDPYRVPDYQYATSIYSVDITNIVLSGISSFYRIGDMKVLLDNHMVHMIANIGTEELEGSCFWGAGVAGLITKSGIASFTVEYINVLMSVNQSLDIRRRPQIIDLHVNVGNIQLRMDGAGVLDYIAELGVNLLPNLLRYQIVQAAEKPIRRKIQEAMDSADIEQMIMDKLPMIDEQLSKRNDVKILEDNFVEEETLMKEKEEEQEIDF